MLGGWSSVSELSLDAVSNMYLSSADVVTSLFAS